MRDPFAQSREPNLRPDAGRFEEGNQNMAVIHGLEASLDLMARIGMERIEEQNLWLTDRILAGVQERGYEILTPMGPGERSAIALFKHPTQAAGDICRGLRKHSVVAIERDGAVRASPHFFNSPAEVD